LNKSDKDKHGASARSGLRQDQEDTPKYRSGQRRDHRERAGNPDRPVDNSADGADYERDQGDDE
jgi:hypothetical protein